jgi:hypothetical protein
MLLLCVALIINQAWLRKLHSAWLLLLYKIPLIFFPSFQQWENSIIFLIFGKGLSVLAVNYFRAKYKCCILNLKLTLNKKILMFDYFYSCLSKLKFLGSLSYSLKEFMLFFTYVLRMSESCFRNCFNAWFHVLTAVLLRIQVFWVWRYVDDWAVSDDSQAKLSFEAKGTALLTTQCHLPEDLNPKAVFIFVIHVACSISPVHYIDISVKLY